MLKRLVKSALNRLGYELRPVAQPVRYAQFAEPEIRDYEALKDFAVRTAQFCASETQADLVRSFSLTGILNREPHGSASEVEIGDARTLGIGVWRRQAAGNDAVFTRDPGMRSEWFYWADSERIEPKRTKTRIVLLGESVARGYFYDPQFNVASVLRTMLAGELGRETFDVVDLAKSNLRMPELKSCIGKSLALFADVIVIFAGNNWHPHLLESDIPCAASLLRSEGVPGLKAYMDQKRAQAARNLISQANELLLPRNVSIVWVIPETNLADWKDVQSEAPLLTGNGNTRWRELHRALQAAMRSADWPEAERLAVDMHELDRGTSTVPLRVLADRAIARGDQASARRYLEECRDAVGWDPTFSYSPRIFSPIQHALREARGLPRNAVVDLPSLFDRHLGGELAGRRLFLDYCHMAAEGISVACAEIASSVVALVAGRQVSGATLHSRAESPAAKIEGKACFLAAAHNAAYYQSVDIVRHWCDRALEFWPAGAPLMARFADYASRDLPIVMCKSGLELSDLDELDMTRYLLHGRPRRLDLSFADAAVASLGELGIDIGDSIAQLRITEHSPKSGPKQLNEFFYSAGIPALFEQAWTSRAFPTNHGSRAIYASAFWETSKFVFFAEKGQEIAVTLTFRVRFAWFPGAKVLLDLNARRVAVLAAEPSWSSHTIFIPPELIAAGRNEISIAWPAGESASDELLADAARSLLATRLPYMHRVFGEIHSLSIADPSSTTTAERAESLTDRALA